MTTNALIGASADREACNEGGWPTIDFRTATLPNGLTLVVHEDRRHPLIATQLRFNVGSKDEPAGRTGFAHLFEHLMFKASANRRKSWHAMLRELGGIGINGTTSPDRTNYYQVVPSAAIDQLLWMESDRMGHLLGGIDAATLADELSVVKNEKREREGAPYGGVIDAIATSLYPRDHPYGHTVLGSFEDLDKANMATVADWYGRWYGAANAVLVIAGDIGFDEALEKVEHWFGAMPPGPPVQRVTRWLPDAREPVRVMLQDRVPHRRLYMIWSAPPAADIDAALLHSVAAMLSGGSHSRLMRRLVDRDRLCIGVAAQLDARYLSSEFYIVATLAPGVDAAMVEHAILEEVAHLAKAGPTPDELDRVRRTTRFNMLRMLDNLSGKTELLASSMMTFGSPDGYMEQIEARERAAPDDVRAVAERWLSRPAVVLDVQPFAAVQPLQDPAMRSVAPPVGRTSAPGFPAVERVTLANGLTIRFVRRPQTQSVEMALYLQGGATLDPVGAEGLSRMALAALDRGTARRTKHMLSETWAETGIKYGVDVRHDSAILSMNALKDQAGIALDLLAELLLEASFPENEISLLLDRHIAQALGATVKPASAADLASRPLIYGAGHAFGRSATGTPDSLTGLTRHMMMARHRQWLDPAQATLVVVGDIAMAELVTLVEGALGGWTARDGGPDGAPSIWTPQPGRFMIERRGGAQTALNIAMASPAIRQDDVALDLFNNLFGGSFGSRLNANLRERRGWTYGISSRIAVSPKIGNFRIAAEVEAARTLDALAEIEAELRGLSRERPITDEEMEDARRALLVRLPSTWASNRAVADAVIEQIAFDLPDDWHGESEARLLAVTAHDLARVVALLGEPDRYSWVVVGDPVHMAGLDAVHIDAQGHRL
ncbi:zinc protease [Novosphingobium sp. CF614]|uniref:M16 family metallopeptidase n=1 Tax=Novosphingobium sp. CF614 TaxID=1884364 RepID=UPI0008E638D2|nr:pitrilysin family protein [Novosphingobium sp. CF614]SFF82529.1 zinc protease [Novosphingobium sp. CF614]